MDETYWEKCGKYQDKMNEFIKILPNVGYTNNKYMNLFIAASHLYYDVHNNGGGNISACFAKDYDSYVLQVLPGMYKSNLQKFINCDCNYLESFMNQVIEFIQDKDLSYESFEIWRNPKDWTISSTPVEEFTHITFGNKKDMNTWIRSSKRK